MSSGTQSTANQEVPHNTSNATVNAATQQSTGPRTATAAQQGAQPQRYPVTFPGASPPGQQAPRPFPGLMQGTPAGLTPGGTLDGAQMAMFGAPHVGTGQAHPQLGSPQMGSGQQSGIAKGPMLGQLQYHPPQGGQQRVQLQQYTSPPLTVQQIQQLQQLQAQQQQQLQARAAQAQGQPARPHGPQRVADLLPRVQAGPPQSPPHASLPRAPMPTHMQGTPGSAQKAQPGATSGQQPRPQTSRSTVVQHAPTSLQLQVAQHMQAQQGARPQQTQGGMPAVPGSEGKGSASITPGSLQSLQSPQRPNPRPSPKVSKVVTLAGPIKKHCNCKNSRCLKLYCECFASGRYCDNCNCVNCCNNKESEQVRQAAVEAILERNPNAFRPKIQGGDDAAALAAGPAARHNKGCNCKKSGCLKKYCECFQASIYCSDNCKCIDCKNFEGSDAREMVMMSLVHEHNRSMNAHNAAKRARMAASHMPQQPQFPGAATGSMGPAPIAPRGAMPAIPGGMQAHAGPPGPMTQLLQQEGPPPPLQGSSAPMPTSEGLSGGGGSMTQHIAGSPMPSPRLTSPGARQPLKPLVHSRTVLQETMREMVTRGGLEEMTSLLWLIAQDTEQKVTPKPDANEGPKSPPDAEKPGAVDGSSSSGGAGGGETTPHSSYSGPSRVFAAQEKAVLQEFHFILKKISDRVLKKTAQEVEQTAAAKATASAALAAAPGNLMNHPGGMASPAPSPRMQQPASSPFPGVQQSPGQMRVLHIAQSPQGARPAGTPQMPQQQRMVNLSAYGRPGGPSPQSSPGLKPLQMGQARPPAGTASAPHQPWQALLHPGHLGSPQGGPRPGGVMYSAPPRGPLQPPQSAGQHPVNIRFSNHSGPTTLILPSSSAPPASMQQPILAPPSHVPSTGGMAAAAGFMLPHQRPHSTQPQASPAGLPGQPQYANAAQISPRLPGFGQMVMGAVLGQPASQLATQAHLPMGQPSVVKVEQSVGIPAPQQQQQQQQAAPAPGGAPQAGS